MGAASFQHLTVNATPAREVWQGGKLWLVADLSMIVPDTVLNGSKGALLYPMEECRASVPEWDGVPITVRHPSDPVTNAPLSAWDEGVWQRQGIGVVRDPSISDKLRAKGWFDADRTRAMFPEVFNALQQGKALELSTGLFTDNEPRQGTDARGRPYDYVARNYRADHLAVLPDQIGACSVRDGCGVLVNSGNGRRADMVANRSFSQEVQPMTLLERFVNWLTRNTGRDQQGQFSAGGKGGAGDLGGDPNEYDEEDGPIDPLTGEPIFKEKGKTNNAGKCPECGKAMLTDNCPCGYARNAGRHQETGQFLPNGAPSKKQVHSQVGKGFKGGQPSDPTAPAKPIGERGEPGATGDSRVKVAKRGTIDLDGDGDSDQPSTAQNPGNREPTADADSHDPKDIQMFADSVKNAEHCLSMLTVNEFASDDQREAFFGLLKEHGGKEGEKAVDKSEHAHSMSALAKSGMMSHKAAAEAHAAAGKEHWSKMKATNDKSMKEGHAKAAKEHFAKQKEHASKVNNAMPFPPQQGPQAQDPSMTPHHQMSKQAAGASLMTEHDDARGHADGAMAASSGGDSAGAAKLHRKAATAHEAAATEARQDGDEGAADQHDVAGALHRKAASMHQATCNRKRTDNVAKITTRTEALKVLTSNCRCDQDRAAFNSMSDATLIGLANNDGGPAAADGGSKKGWSQSVQAGGQEDDPQDLDESDDTPGGDMKQGVKAKGTVENWLASAPPAVRSVVANAINVENCQKRRLVARLVANVGDEGRRKALFGKYMRKDLAELRELVGMMPQVQNFAAAQDLQQDEPALNFLGAAGGPVDQAWNSGGEPGEGDVLPLPTMNWSEPLVPEQNQRQAR